MFSYFSKDIGIDLGTANSLVYLRGRGIAISEPSVIAVNTKTGQILAVGGEAKEMIGRTPSHISVIRPLVNGVISDFEITQEMLRYFLQKIGRRGNFLNYRRAVIGIPSNLTEVERKSVEDAVVGAGVNRAYLIEEPVAAALGSGLPIESPVASMVIDIGGGTIEIAIISMGGVVMAKSLKIAGDKFNEEIIKFIHEEFRLIIGEPTAEKLKIACGSAIPVDEKLEMRIRGRDLASGLPREVIIRNHHIRLALARSLRSIIEAVKDVIEVSPPELVGDVLKEGISLSGGGSLLRGIDILIQREIEVPVKVAEDPLTAVARGIGIAIEDMAGHRHIFDNPFQKREIIL